MSYARVTGAAGYPGEVRDMALSATAENVTTPSKAREVLVQVKIAPDRLSFVEKEGRKNGFDRSRRFLCRFPRSALSVSRGTRRSSR